MASFETENVDPATQLFHHGKIFDLKDTYKHGKTSVTVGRERAPLSDLSSFYNVHYEEVICMACMGQHIIPK